MSTTAIVYEAIKDGRFPEAVHLLTSELGVKWFWLVLLRTLFTPKVGYMTYVCRTVSSGNSAAQTRAFVASIYR